MTWIDLVLFYGKAKFGLVDFRMKKLKKYIFLLLLCFLIQECIPIQALWNSSGQGHLVTLPQK